MKVFDWIKAEEQNRPLKLEWLKENWDKKVSVEEYQKAMKEIKPTQNKPSDMKHQYEYLKKTFGFFK